MDLGTAIASSFSAGISMYGVIALLGIAGRLDWVSGDSVLEQPWVIALALALFAVEFVVDKIALLDTVWDGVHTVLRPMAGALILSVAPDQALPVPVALGVGAGLALVSHSAKSSTRLLVNASPEPVSNVVVSTAEDGLVAALMALAFANPEIAFAVTLVLVVVAIGLIVLAWRLVGHVRRRWRARATSRQESRHPAEHDLQVLLGGEGDRVLGGQPAQPGLGGLGLDGVGGVGGQDVANVEVLVGRLALACRHRHRNQVHQGRGGAGPGPEVPQPGLLHPLPQGGHEGIGLAGVGVAPDLEPGLLALVPAQQDPPRRRVHHQGRARHVQRDRSAPRVGAGHQGPGPGPVGVLRGGDRPVPVQGGEEGGGDRHPHSLAADRSTASADCPMLWAWASSRASSRGWRPR